jgi:hypothetical protein
MFKKTSFEALCGKYNYAILRQKFLELQTLKGLQMVRLNILKKGITIWMGFVISFIKKDM